MKKIKWLCIILIVLFSMAVQASGPVLPDKYRLPSEDELSAEWRGIDTDKYASIAADFNGDGLVDGCFLASDKKRKKLALLVVLTGNAGNSEKWYILDTLNYEAIKYMGIETIKPSTIMVYPPKGDNQKTAKEITNYSIKFFASEGSSSIFYWDKATKRFKRLWMTK